MAARKSQKRVAPKKRRRSPRASRPRYVSQAAYARHRRVSRAAVAKAIASGRLKDSLIWIDGVAWIRDIELADKEWAANTDLSRAHDDVKERAAAVIDAPPEGRVIPFSPAPASESEEATTIAKASAMEKYWRAKKAELDYKRAAGELVDAADVEAQIVDVFTTCRTKLLGLPSKAKSRLPHLSLADVAVLDDIARESLEALVPETVSL